ncbi:MAG TPA: hypothetical protein VFN87_21770 [Solirubrobacteraceae bacterium]|nr:hypothetical protein [Solirubrobacteraceae bacterium]
MAVQSPTPQQRGGAAGTYDEYPDEERGFGWVSFAATLLLLVGTMNLIEGIAAVGNAHFFVGDARYVVGDLNTWGWVAICLGAIQWLVGLGVFFKNQLARWTGVVILGLNAIAQLLMMPAYPFWSLVIFAMDILAMYGLIAYGKRIGAAS